MAKENALDRLNKYMEPSNEREYTVEEQLDSISTDEFLDDMSGMAKDQMSHLIEEVTLEEPKTEAPMMESVPEQTPIPEQIQAPETPVSEFSQAPIQPEIQMSTPVVEQPVETVEQTVEAVEEPKIENKELFNDNSVQKPKRKYVRSGKYEKDKNKEKTESAEETETMNNNNSAEEAPVLMDNSKNPVLDQLAKDLIDDLIKCKYKINRFDDKSMKMIFDYMYKKF